MRDVIRYYLKAYKNPKMNMLIVTTKVNKLEIVVKMHFVLAVAMSLGSLLHYLFGVEPVIPKLLNISSQGYYLLQGIYMIPLMFLIWIMSAGVLYLVGISGKTASRRFFFDDAMVIVAYGWTVPWLFIVIVPDLLVYNFTGILLGIIGEIIRRIALPFIWQTVIQVIGIHEIYHNSWRKSVVVSLLTSAAFYLMVGVFLR